MRRLAATRSLLVLGMLFPTTSQDFVCTLDANGNHTILVRDNNGTGTGNDTVPVDEL